MATRNFTDGTITAHERTKDTLPNTGGPYCRGAVIDFTKQNLDSGNNDVAQVINIPANTWVLGVFVRVITAESTNAEIEIGYGSDDAYWTDTILEVDSTGQKASNYFTTPLYFASADTIDIVNNNNDVDYDALVIEIQAMMMPGADTDQHGWPAST